MQFCTEFEHILVSKNGKVGVIQLNRPKVGLRISS